LKTAVQCSDLATLTRNTVRFGHSATFPVLATPIQIQRCAFELLGHKARAVVRTRSKMRVASALYSKNGSSSG
jgi:hypothetical protein